MSTTINQKIKQINSFADQHKMIHSFGEGNIVDLASSGETKYMTLWAEVLPTSVNLNTDASSQYTTRIRVYVLDRMLKGGTNYNKILSDTQGVILDLISHLSNSYAFEWMLDASDLTIYGDPKFDDESAGHSVDLGFREPLTKDRCAIPFTTDPTP